MSRPNNQRDLARELIDEDSDAFRTPSPEMNDGTRTVPMSPATIQAIFAENKEELVESPNDLFMGALEYSPDTNHDGTPMLRNEDERAFLDQIAQQIQFNNEASPPASPMDEEDRALLNQVSQILQETPTPSPPATPESPILLTNEPVRQGPRNPYILQRLDNFYFEPSEGAARWAPTMYEQENIRPEEKQLLESKESDFPSPRTLQNLRDWVIAAERHLESIEDNPLYVQQFMQENGQHYAYAVQQLERDQERRQQRAEEQRRQREEVRRQQEEDEQRSNRVRRMR